jgi:hypothetical protein
MFQTEVMKLLANPVQGREGWDQARAMSKSVVPNRAAFEEQMHGRATF